MKQAGRSWYQEIDWAGWLDQYIDPALYQTLDAQRRAQLLVGFSLTGSWFCLGYAVFYAAIQHFAGAGVLLVTCLVFQAIARWVRRGPRMSVVAGGFIATLLVLFLILGLLEGGIHGHALAWLATLPMWALMLSPNRRQGVRWGVAALLATTGFGVLSILGIDLPYVYAAQWHPWVTGVGYAGLAMYMFALGIISEESRQTAERRRDEALEELRQANERLLELDQQKNEFLGIAAHDLRSPLSVVLGYAKIIESQKDPQLENVAGYARIIGESTERMAAILDDLLDVNAMESGEYPLRPEATDLAGIVHASLEVQYSAATRKQIDVETLIEPAPVWADPGALRQVVDNLLSNAVKYTDAGGRVRVEVNPGDAEARMSVWNNGQELSEADQSKLFTRFARLSPRPTGDEPSTGLGLSIVKRIVDSSGGRVTCESGAGEGTRFVVCWPAKEQ